MKIVMTESLAISPEALRAFVRPIEAAGHQFVNAIGSDHLLQEVQDADIFVVANSPMPEAVIEAAKELKLISVGFTGLDHIPLKLCAEKGIRVVNAAGYATVAVAEMTLGLILSCLRFIPACDKAVRAGGTKAGLVGNELYGKTVGIVGTGAIGLRTAQILKAFGCKLLGYSRTQRPEALEMGIEYLPLDDLLQQADIVCLHTPLTAETQKLIDERRIGLMKPEALLINVARGGVVDNAALARALKEGKIAGAGIDVYEGEPPIPADNPLLSAPNTVLTPHSAFATAESMVKRARIVFNTVYEYLGIAAN